MGRRMREFWLTGRPRDERLRLNGEGSWLAVQMLLEHPLTGGKVADNRHFETVGVTSAERPQDGRVALRIGDVLVGPGVGDSNDTGRNQQNANLGPKVRPCLLKNLVSAQPVE